MNRHRDPDRPVPPPRAEPAEHGYALPVFIDVSAADLATVIDAFPAETEAGGTAAPLMSTEGLDDFPSEGEPASEGQPAPCLEAIPAFTSEIGPASYVGPASKGEPAPCLEAVPAFRREIGPPSEVEPQTLPARRLSRVLPFRLGAVWQLRRPVMRLPRIDRHDRSAVVLTALSASIFLGVAVFTGVVDRINQSSPSPAVPAEVTLASAGPPRTSEQGGLAVLPSRETDLSKTRVLPEAPRSIAPSGINPAEERFPLPLTAKSQNSEVIPPPEGGDSRSTELVPREASLGPISFESLVPPSSEPVRVAGALSPRSDAGELGASMVSSRSPDPPVASEADEIGGVLTRYRGAVNALDSAAARTVWPTVDERALDRAFARLLQQEVTFDTCLIDVTGARAAANCRGIARYVPKVGSRNPQTAARQWKFSLQKVEDRWVIEGVDAR